MLLHDPGTPAVRGEQRDAGAAQVVETQLLREAGAGHRGPEMAGVKLCQRSGPPSVAVNTKPSRLAVGPYPAGLRFLAAQVAGIAYHDDQPRRHDCGSGPRSARPDRSWRTLSPLRFCRSGADNSAVLAQTSEQLFWTG